MWESWVSTNIDDNSLAITNTHIDSPFVSKKEDHICTTNNQAELPQG